MSELAERIDGYLTNPRVSCDDRLTAVTGLSETAASEYADPDARPAGYFGRDTAVETVAELVCSDATMKGVPTQWQWGAARDVLSAPITPDDAADVVDRRRESAGGLRRLFGEPPSDDFDPAELTDDDLALLRLYTAFGSSVEAGESARRYANADTVRHDDFRAANHGRMQYCWRDGRHSPGVDLDRMHTPASVSAVMEMYDSDEVILTTASDPTALGEADALAESVTTHVPAKLVVAASLLFRRNFARPDALGDVYIAPSGEEQGDRDLLDVLCVFVAPDSDLRYGVATWHGDRMRGKQLTRAVREYLG